MFQGTSLLVLDAKGRLSLPSNYRESLLVPSQGEVTLTRHPDGCVLIYPRSVWIQTRAKLASLPYSARTLQRVMLGSACDVSADGSGRLLIPGDLRSLCGLRREVTLIGLGNRFELWDQAKYMQFENDELKKGLPPDVFDLVL